MGCSRLRNCRGGGADLCPNLPPPLGWNPWVLGKALVPPKGVPAEGGDAAHHDTESEGGGGDNKIPRVGRGFGPMSEAKQIIKKQKMNAFYNY